MRGCHDKFRNSWAQVAGIADIRFFIGGARPDDLSPDEVWLDVPDDYLNLPYKVGQMCQWMVSHDYAYMLKTDNDSLPLVDRITQLNPICDYVGEFSAWRCALGGGYRLSRKAAEIVSRHTPNHWAEDVCTSNALEPFIQDGEILTANIKICDYMHWGEGICRTCYRPISNDAMVCGLHSASRPRLPDSVAIQRYDREGVKGNNYNFSWVTEEEASRLIFQKLAERANEWEHIRFSGGTGRGETDKDREEKDKTSGKKRVLLRWRTNSQLEYRMYPAWDAQRVIDAGLAVLVEEGHQPQQPTSQKEGGGLAGGLVSYVPNRVDRQVGCAPVPAKSTTRVSSIVPTVDPWPVFENKPGYLVIRDKQGGRLVGIPRQLPEATAKELVARGVADIVVIEVKRETTINPETKTPNVQRETFVSTARNLNEKKPEHPNTKLAGASFWAKINSAREKK